MRARGGRPFDRSWPACPGTRRSGASSSRLARSPTVRSLSPRPISAASRSRHRALGSCASCARPKLGRFSKATEHLPARFLLYDLPLPRVPARSCRVPFRDPPGLDHSPAASSRAWTRSAPALGRCQARLAVHQRGVPGSGSGRGPGCRSRTPRRVLVGSPTALGEGSFREIADSIAVSA